MEFTSSDKQALIEHILSQLASSCELIMLWNKNLTSTDQYLCSPEGMQKMAATCMLLESIGEGVKKINKIIPGFLTNIFPDIPWKNIMGLRDHIAHGYFNLDAGIIYDVAINEIPNLHYVFTLLQTRIQQNLQ